jgi:hypothetical protein
MTTRKVRAQGVTCRSQADGGGRRPLPRSWFRRRARLETPPGTKWVGLKLRRRQQAQLAVSVAEARRSWPCRANLAGSLTCNLLWGGELPCLRGCGAATSSAEHWYYAALDHIFFAVEADIHHGDLSALALPPQPPGLRERLTGSPEFKLTRVALLPDKLVSR